MAQVIILAYRVVLWVLLPFVFIITATHSIRHHTLRYFLQRFSLARLQRSDLPLWIHAASVGELNVALNFAHAWNQCYPQQKIVISTATASAGQVFAQKAPSFIEHCYLPLDYAWFCKRFIKALNPSAAIIVETEIWLNLYRACAQAGLAPIIINARLSQTTTRHRCLAMYYQESLNLVSAVLARSEADRLAYIALGVSEEKTQTLGNLKYSTVMQQDIPQRQGPVLDREYVLCASTHDNEELMLAEAWDAATIGNLLLVIAPRHIKRSKKIATDLQKLGLRVVRHSDKDKHTDRADIYLYDCFGGMDALMQNARLVFLGGSLVPVGGHNLMEAALANTPQAVGPYLANVHEEAEALLACRGLLAADNAQDLVGIFSDIARDQGAFTHLAQNASHYLKQQSGIAQNYVDALALLRVVGQDPIS